MGSGKTTLTRFILRNLGLSEIIPVTSPTFSYLNEYEINSDLYAHMDLFRADGHFEAEDLGLTGEREFRGYFIEWPTQIAHEPFLNPTHKLKIFYDDGCSDISERNYEFFEFV